MKLLQVPTMELDQRIKQEIEENPALEEGKEELDEEYSNEEGKKIFKSLYGGVWYSVEMQIERLSSYEQSFK